MTQQVAIDDIADLPGLVPAPRYICTATPHPINATWESLVVTQHRVTDIPLPSHWEWNEPLAQWQQDESYRLRCANGQVEIYATTEVGAFRARRRLDVLRQCADEAEVPHSFDLVDAPCYRHRGLSVDIVRHFFGLDTLIPLLDLMADVALNVLHLHLSDDQGWRYEVPQLPALTEISGHTAVGEATGGYLSQADLDTLVEQAHCRHIQVIPEVDIPGHTNAALHALPGLNPNGQCPPAYKGIEVGFSTLSTAAPDTELFLHAAIDALIPHSQAGIHIGGDESFSTTEGDYEAIVRMAAARVRAHGQRVIGWQESAPYLEAGDLVQIWDPRLDPTQVIEATQRGVGVIVSYAHHAYLDMKQVDDESIGLDWAGIVPLAKSLQWDSRTVVAELPAEAIEGVEACLWTETVENSAHFGELVLPRLHGIAEVAWRGSAVGQWASFRRRIAGFSRLWRARGWNYFPSAGVDWA
ncbi:family 20 glycosylhydrolase [Schaalia suimastitidis]|uniref:family 20 glycosylhydrolase n=1 Tax=Schaalia suimastitidis TaxID=121163 RepID=UPI0003F9BEF5|nr:family 20 glycosylhydrolase [Schaalia suimastitidis]